MRAKKATAKDLIEIKDSADRNKAELGFVIKAALEEGILEQRVLVVTSGKGCLRGWLHFRHRRDGHTKVYQVCVDREYRCKGVGNTLLQTLVAEATSLGQNGIVLLCPEDLPANGFYQHFGFRLNAAHSGKKRKLLEWAFTLPASSSRVQETR